MLDMERSSPVVTYKAFYSDVDNAKCGKRHVDSEKTAIPAGAIKHRKKLKAVHATSTRISENSRPAVLSCSSASDTLLNELSAIVGLLPR